MTTEQMFWSTVGLWFVRELWPFIKDRVYPDLAAARTQASVQEIEREDRLFQAFQANTAAVTGLQLTLGSVSEQMREMASVVRELNEDVAGLYGSLQKPRPSRVKAEVHAR